MARNISRVPDVLEDGYEREMIGESPQRVLRRLAPPSLVALAGLGALAYLRGRLHRGQVYRPDRYPNGVWDPRSFGLEVEDTWFRTPDGLTLHGWWIPHPKAQATILYCHGNSGSIAHQIGVFRFIQRLRVNVLGFDYRGYGRSEGSPTEEGLYLDARAAYDHLTGELGQAGTSILLFGHSLGGAVAIDCAQDRPVAGLVVQSSFTHLRDAARHSIPTLPLHLLTRREFDSVAKVSRLSMPKLFIHGEADGTLPVELAERLYEVASPPKELYVVARGGHNDLYRHGGLRYLLRLARFRKRCLAVAAG